MDQIEKKKNQYKIKKKGKRLKCTGLKQLTCFGLLNFIFIFLWDRQLVVIP